MLVRNKVLVNKLTAAFSTNVFTMKFCANLSFMFQESATFTDRYQLASDAGFKAVESGFPFGYTIEQVKEAKEKAELNQVLINLCTGNVGKGELGVTFKPGKEDEFRQNLAKTIEYAKALKCSKLHVMAGNIEEERNQEHWTTYESNLKYASEQLKTAGLIGLIEPINKYSVPKYFMNSFDKAIEIIKRIDSPHLRLMLDVFHLQQIQGDISHSIQELMPYVGHVQIAQVPKRNEPDSAGEINYRYVLNQLKESGYDGYVGLEYSPLKGTKQGLGWIQQFGYTLD